MEGILAPHQGYAGSYIEDIIVFSPNWETHHQHLQQILEGLRQAGLTANPKKCILGKRETQYLGFLVGQGIIKPMAVKVAAIRQHPLPKTLKQLLSFLGFANYYRHFIPGFSERKLNRMN